MSLQSAMYSGVSGIMTLGNAMNVVGDNISNVNTIGFKGNRALFADILANSLSNGSTILQFGRGTFMNGINPSWAQGSFETTGNATDMGIQGAGFFVVKDVDNNATYYSRAGQFTLDRNGLLANPQGFITQGYRVTGVDTAGNITTDGVVQNIDIDGVQAVPNATTNFRVGLNLNASASASTTYSTSFDVYNNLGERITLNYQFTKSATAQTWNYAVTASSGTVTTGSTGTLVFDSSGNLSSPLTNPTLTVSGFGTTGAAALNMTWSLYNTTLGTNFGDITGYSAPSTTTSIIQDGYGTGTLRGLSVSADGVISGLFSNGQSQPLYQLVLADFNSPWGLERVGNSLFAETAQAGQPILGTAASGGMGSILGSSLELSNVDLASEFVRMIQNQRGYQASSRVITTTDDMLTEAVNLKR